MMALLFFGIFIALALDSDFGNIEVKTVSIMECELELSGLLHRPKSAVAARPAAAIVLVHGIGGSKEMMSGIGLELARRGFVSLCLDLYGHGKSRGTVEQGQSEPSFGVYAAVQYLKSQPFVNSSALGLIGHSLGAGAAKAAVAEDSHIGALVLIAGGLGDIVEGPQYGVFNSTYPRNLLIIVGKYDILFDVTELATEELLAVFGIEQEVFPDVLYGSFSSQTARKFVAPTTTHLFEPVDSVVVSESIDWIEKAFDAQGSYEDVGTGLVYLQREAGIAVALVGLLGLAFLSFFPIARFVQAKSKKKLTRTEKTTLENWRLYTTWAVVNLALFVPMFGVGLVISFPPLLFGSSIAWWMLGSGLMGLLFLTKFSKKLFGKKIVLKERLVGTFALDGLMMAVIVFVTLFAIVTILAAVFNFNFRIILPILRDVSSASRALVFAAFVPFFFPYFVAEGLYFHELTPCVLGKQGNWSCSGNYLVNIFAKIGPFVFLLFLQYTIKITINIWILPSFLGFLLEFLWLIVPIFAIASSFSWWFYKRTKNAIYGALFNALLMSWIASAVFPF